MLRDSTYFEDATIGADAGALREQADTVATLIVRGAQASDDPEIAGRVLRLADSEGLDQLAELWSGAPPESVAGCLWRLYALRSWVYADPLLAASQFEEGRIHADVAHVVAGVAEPPGPDEVRVMIDEVLRGIAEREFADVLLRAAAFSRVIAHGRALQGREDANRMLLVSEQLEHAGHQELEGHLS